jgi:hypothetical protein
MFDFDLDQIRYSNVVSYALVRYADDLSMLGDRRNSVFLTKERFQNLADAWKKEKMFCSSMTDIEESPHYRAIIELGAEARPAHIKLDSGTGLR